MASSWKAQRVIEQASYEAEVDGLDALTVENITAAVRRARITEDRIVPEGWRVVWWESTTYGRSPRLMPLVPLSDTPHVAEGEQP